ncbi:hypothetical protein I6A84_10625 [Frankia sp. CNm7]|uniref:Uncharacterized protein n=1 Tax=Frankia nepalensis TaxID=1836974 RepID=A0A937RA02_9ACTN|nr:hypothetical protein [Frankia nepalensis]MBL7494767.1 hypothetical protein [Frankia nepalensis]MBL7514052.1 hypothetical protein [Frankia nepalensis]MBL7518552.1 hypothetical protein [Frankia nepalensis]MBL7626467.1 hypothetical protein [Frankia nepalensis]
MFVGILEDSGARRGGDLGLGLAGTGDRRRAKVVGRWGRPSPLLRELSGPSGKAARATAIALAR